VIRGADHQTNTFKQLLIYRALGWEPPAFAHMSLILADPPNTGKLSKRHGGATVEEYRAAGYPAEAMVNWLAIMGWSYDDKTDRMSRSELIERFDLGRVGKAGARVNRSKLDWLSGEFIREMSPEDVLEPIAERIVGAGLTDPTELYSDPARLRLIAECVQPRIQRFGEVAEQCAWMFGERPAIEAKAEKNLVKDPATAERLERLAAELPDPMPPIDALESWAREFAEREEIGFGKLVHPVRAALTGRTQGPGLFHCFHALGRERSVERLRMGAELARKRATKSG
jgi:glutamyl-tRNA synthetase